jgi:hypothetical protein
MPVHNPVDFASGLSAKLATRSRHVCAFLGAGLGSACGLPDVEGLQSHVLSSLSHGDRAVLEAQLAGRNLEEVLSRLRRIAALLTGDQTVDSLTAAGAANLDKVVCHAIVKALSLEHADLKPVEYFAAWAARADYHLPIELFTVNYDLLLETALEARGVPYFDGFVGNLEAGFQTRLVESDPGDSEWVPSFFIRLWKLHGSVNWARREDHRIVRIGQPVPEDLAAAIYPSDTKYEESRRVPFVVLQDRLRRALYQPETLVVISGYSFGDSHLNELIYEAAARCERSESVVFCYGDIPGELAERASMTPNLQVTSDSEAILGGVRAPWKPPEDPLPALWEHNRFALGDFRNLATYLARSTTRESEADVVLRELMDKAHWGTKTTGSGSCDA